MKSLKKNEKKTGKKDTAKKDKDKIKIKKKAKSTLLTGKPESEGELLLGGSEGELLKGEYDSKGGLLTNVFKLDTSEQKGLLLGKELKSKQDEDKLLKSHPQKGELLTSSHLNIPIESKSEAIGTPELKERTTEEIFMAFDKNLNERGKLQASYQQLRDFLESYNVRCFEYTDVLTQLNLAGYDCLIFACPDASRLNKYEINEIKRFVQNGGGLFLLSHAGGDRGRGTNLNELSQNFGIHFINDQVFDEVHNIGLNSLPIINDFKKHSIFTNIKNICYRAGCSLEVTGGAKLMAHADSIAEPTNAGIIAINKIKLGRVVVIGSYEMFRNQMAGGIEYESHKILFLNILDWLTENKDVSRFIQILERFQAKMQKIISRIKSVKTKQKIAKKKKFQIPILPPKSVGGIEDIDGIIFGFNELKEEFQDLKNEVELNLTEINSIIKGVSLGSVREIEKFKEEFIHFKEERKNFEKTIKTLFMKTGEEFQALHKKMDKLIQELIKKEKIKTTKTEKTKKSKKAKKKK